MSIFPPTTLSIFETPLVRVVIYICKDFLLMDDLRIRDLEINLILVTAWTNTMKGKFDDHAKDLANRFVTTVCISNSDIVEHLDIQISKLYSIMRSLENYEMVICVQRGGRQEYKLSRKGHILSRYLDKKNSIQHKKSLHHQAYHHNDWSRHVEVLLSFLAEAQLPGFHNQECNVRELHFRSSMRLGLT